MHHPADSGSDAADAAVGVSGAVPADAAADGQANCAADAAADHDKADGDAGTDGCAFGEPERGAHAEAYEEGAEPLFCIDCIRKM